MKCEGCGVELEKSQVNHYHGKVLCEDCTFDLLCPPKVCDPTAVSSTLMVRKQLGQTGTDGLSDLQKKIYSLVIERGRISHEVLLEELNLTPIALEKEFAVLRHCELLRGFKENGILYFVKY